MDDLTTLIHSHFKSILLDIQNRSIQSKNDLGNPPSYLIVEQTMPCKHPQFNLGQVMKRWKVTSNEMMEIETDAFSKESQIKNGMYYNFGKGNFSLIENDSKVRIGWQVGPLYGRGYDLRIKDDNGKYKLEDRIHLWMS